MDGVAWLALIALQAVAFSGGFFYSFGAFAADLKTVGDYSQVQINAVGGLCYLLIAGQLIVGWFSGRWPRTVIMVSQGLACLGWLGVVFAAARAPMSFVYTGSCLALIGFGTSSTPAPTVALAYAALNGVPTVRRWAMHGFLALYALSGGFGALAYMYVRPHAALKSRLTAQFVAVTAINFASFVISGLWLLRSRSVAAEPAAPPVEETKSDEKKPLIGKPADTNASATAAEPLGLMWLVPFVCMLLCLFLLFGCAVNFYNNSGSIALSVGARDDEVGYIFLVFCGLQLVGRVASTMWSNAEAPPVRAHFLLVLVAVLTAAVSGLARVHNSPRAMYAYSAVNALAYGSLWVLAFVLPNPDYALPSRVTSRHGLGFVHIYGVICLAPGFGPLVFDLLSGRLYDRHADRTTHLCTGDRCYRDYFLISGVTQVVAIGLALAVLLLRFRGPAPPPLARKMSVAMM